VHITERDAATDKEPVNKRKESFCVVRTCWARFLAQRFPITHHTNAGNCGGSIDAENEHGLQTEAERQRRETETEKGDRDREEGVGRSLSLSLSVFWSLSLSLSFF
jgi:hypothetical protein